jgi:transposase
VSTLLRPHTSGCDAPQVAIGRGRVRQAGPSSSAKEESDWGSDLPQTPWRTQSADWPPTTSYKAYDNPTGRAAVTEHDYVPHIRRIGEEKLDSAREKRYPARRWVVDGTLDRLSKCRALLVRYDKKASNFLGLI